MNEAQVWAALGIFAAAFTAVVTVTSTLLVRVLRSEVGSLRKEMNTRFDHLDRDVNALMKHTFGIDRG